MHICADSSESLSHVVMKLCPSPQFFNRAGSQTLKAGRKSRERERDCIVLAHVLFFQNLETQCLGQADEDPYADPESFVRGGPTLQL